MHFLNLVLIYRVSFVFSEHTQYFKILTQKFKNHLKKGYAGKNSKECLILVLMRKMPATTAVRGHFVCSGLLGAEMELWELACHLGETINLEQLFWKITWQYQETIFEQAILLLGIVLEKLLHMYQDIH